MVGHGIGFGDEECTGPQHVHRTMKHGSGSVMIWKYMMAFGLGAMYKIAGGMNKHLYKFILEFFCGPLYKITIWIQVGWYFNRIMIPSTQARSCKNGWHHNHFNSFNGMHNLWI